MKWKLRFLSVIENEICNWSKDPSTAVGAIVVRGRNKQVVGGYNGFAAGVNDTEQRLNNRELKLKLTIHAEMNCLLTAKEDLQGCTIICNRPPCVPCTSAIIQSGITHVVWRKPPQDFIDRWGTDFELSKEIMEEANVTYEEIS